MITAHIHEVTGSNPIHPIGTIILVVNRRSDAPGLTYKGTRTVSNLMFPLAGVVVSGSFKAFADWEDFEAAIDEDDFRAACPHPALA